jgi:V8-like Glu-specific endopeptidase
MLHPRWDATQPTGFDIAVLRIDSSCPAPSRWFGMVSDALHPGATINVAGYSQATVPAAAIYGAGKVSHCSATEFEHDADTFEGESGAPVIVWDGAVSGQLLVAGVLSRWETTPNLACLLRDEVIHWALNANLPDP